MVLQNKIEYCNKDNNNKSIELTDVCSTQLDKNEEPPADFEKAITSTGFGKFNIILFMIALPSTWASEFDFTSTSYILPAAQCDLNLSLLQKGILNASAYLGTVVSAFLWGFMADTLGRRKLLIYGYFVDAFFVLLSALSQNFWMLFAIKFINGFVISGPYAIIMSFISEFHCARYRAPILLLSGVFFSLANISLSALAWWIIPLNIRWSFCGGLVVINSWQIFLMICAVPSLVSGIAHITLPESPKFLMTAGRNEEAMEAFKIIYSMNTGNPAEYYPVKRLVDEKAKSCEKLPVPELDLAMKETRFIDVLKTGWKQINPIFKPPYLMRIIHIFSTLFLGLLGENTLRLWLPQLFTKMDEYNQLHNYNHTASLCEMLDVSRPVLGNGTAVFPDTSCSVLAVDDQVYINTMVVASSNFVGFIIASSIVNGVGKKFMLIIMYAACGISSLANYWSTSSNITLALVSIHGGVASICTSTMISVIVDLFPTTLRTMTISLAMMFGRMGSIIGNVVFPVLLETGCLPPFLLIGGTALVCTVSSMFLPNLKMKSLD